MRRPTSPGDHWHTALDVNICGEWLGPAPAFEKPYDSPNQVANAGIHSHADGLIHTHPFVVGEEGNNATIGKFFSYGGWGLSSDSIDLGGENAAHAQWHGPKSAPEEDVVEQRRRVSVREVQGAEGPAHVGRRRQEEDRQPVRLPPAGRRNGGDLHAAEGRGRCRSRPGACTSFNQISDQQSAILSKNSPCRAIDATTTTAPGATTTTAPAVTYHVHPVTARAVKAVVLVGGEGTRLRPLTYATPKPLLPIVNQAFLERQLTWLAQHGVDEVVLSLGYLPDAFEAHFPDGRFGDLKLRYAVEDHPLGTAGAIRFAARGIEERIIVCNGDVLTTLDLDALVAFHDARGGEATIHLTRVADPSAFGVVPTRDDGEVVAFVEKPPKGRGPHELDQRRHLRARALGARAHPRAPHRVDRARDLPAHARGCQPALRDGE